MNENTRAYFITHNDTTQEAFDTYKDYKRK